MRAERARSQRIRALRPAKPALDPWRPIDVLLEEERQGDGRQAQVLTVFLTGRECPFTCVFCDLWHFTTDEPTPVGAIPAQIDEALRRFEGELRDDAQIKLFNASNFFDQGAVPAADDPEILRLIERFDQVIVECHPRLVRQRRCSDFAARLAGRLQVAMGLETIHPEAVSRLGKQAVPDDYRAAAEWLAKNGVTWRAFVLVGAPFVPTAERAEWVDRTVRFAFDHGAEHVALVPVRGGNGEIERLQNAGLFQPPTLGEIEQAIEGVIDHAATSGRVVTVDTWDLQQFADCNVCSDERIERLERVNRSGRLEPAVACSTCG
ncbi:MAG: radical SAM protein [Acidobacteriota bacterium]